MNTEPVNEIGLEIAETVVVEKKKRGRKKLLPIQVETNIQPQDNTDEPIKPPPKKRGRKPKKNQMNPNHPQKKEVENPKEVK